MNRWLGAKNTRSNVFKSKIPFTILLVITQFMMLASFSPPLQAAATTRSLTSSFGNPMSMSDQELRVNLGREPVQIDPNLATWSTERTVVLQCFEGLLGYNPDLTLKPVVAAEIPSIANGGISADGKTYTFHLNSGRLWSDGPTGNSCRL